MTPFRSVADFARTLHRTISYEQLLALANAEQIRHMERSGLLWRRFRGVYALEGPLEPIGDLHAAVLYGGARSMSTRFSAAVLQRLVPAWPLEPQIVIANGAGNAGPEGINVHHSRTLLQRDVTEVDGIRTTAIPRTIIDCARHLDAPRVKRLIVETDGRTAHDRSIAFVEDRKRDRALQLAGWRVVRYAWNEVAYEPASVRSELSAACSTASAGSEASSTVHREPVASAS